MTNAPFARLTPTGSTYAGVLAVLVISVLVYLPGLDGPFLFDDPPNLIIPISAWLDGKTGWQEILLGNRSGIFGRPVSMLTFVANAAASGLEPFPFKVTNLAIHLLCGVLVFALMARLLVRDPQLQSRARLVALLIASIWLLHPMQVSTVLYVVQRMAQLSTLFMLVAILVFVIGRLALEQGRARAALGWLFVALPAATILAVLSKENGALVPLLCAVIELGYFRASVAVPRPRAVKVFFSVFLLAPAALAIAAIAWKPQIVLGGYEGRLFTLGERLLSEPRALLDYVGALLLPRGPALGIYTDDFPVSRALLDPPGTLFAILGLAALVAAAAFARTRVPAVFTGIGLYLAGHAMESTFFPLELYFEHRNYLPSLGIFLALSGLVAVALSWLPATGDTVRARKLVGAGALAVVAMLAVASFARASIWSSWPLLAEQGVQQHPQSLRAHLDQISMLLAQSRNDDAMAVYDQVAGLDNPSAENVAAFGRIQLQCVTRNQADAESVARIAAIAGQRLQLAELMSAENLANRLIRQDCAGISKDQLAVLLAEMAERSGQPSRLTQVWRMRFVASRLFLAANQLARAQEQAALAWMSGRADLAVGVYLANLYYLSNDSASARIIREDVEKRIPSWDMRNRKILDEIRTRFETPRGDVPVPNLQPGVTSAKPQSG